jgi:hypothetical protein
MKHLHRVKPARNILIVVFGAVAAATALTSTVLASPGLANTVLASPGSATTSAASALLYNYEFTGTTGTVVNSAPNGPDVPLTLYGTWSPVSDGVHFMGNTSGDESVAYGKPATGYTLNEPAGAAVGFGTLITYFRPATGKCFPDTPNVTQIGRFTTKPFPTQAKLQLSSCTDNPGHVVMECRFAGSLTVSDQDQPVLSTLPLLNDERYVVSCMKTPDQDGTTTITLSVTPVKTGQTTTNTFSEPALGKMRSTAYISAGNKYMLPPPSGNTDQFNGDMTSAVYCAGSTADVQSCLQTYLPT